MVPEDGRSPLRLALAAAYLLAAAASAGAMGFLGADEDGTFDDLLTDATSGASAYPVAAHQPFPGFSDGPAPKALIVRADPKTGNLSEAAMVRMASDLASDGWEVEVRDLYASGFDPVVTAGEMAFEAPVGGSVDPVVAEYQGLIRQADALVLIYPLWWKQPPAMMRGWMERVFTCGFAYEFLRGSQDSVLSLLAGKKVLFVNFLATSESLFQDLGYQKSMDMTDRSLLEFTGMEFAGRHIVYSAMGMSDQEKADSLDALAPLASVISPSYR